MRSAGVAGHNDSLDPLFQQPMEDLEAVSFDGIGRLGSVRHSGRIPEVDSRLIGQPFIDGAGDREPTDAGVEDPHRSLVHCTRTGMETEAPNPPGTAWKRRSPGKSA